MNSHNALVSAAAWNGGRARKHIQNFHSHVMKTPELFSRLFVLFDLTGAAVAAAARLFCSSMEEKRIHPTNVMFLLGVFILRFRFI